ncbi:MAG: hypothetical protein ACK4OJ_08620, partial [Brevundimonas sp.]
VGRQTLRICSRAHAVGLHTTRRDATCYGSAWDDRQACGAAAGALAPKLNSCSVSHTSVSGFTS